MQPFKLLVGCALLLPVCNAFVAPSPAKFAPTGSSLLPALSLGIKAPTNAPQDLSMIGSFPFRTKEALALKSTAAATGGEDGSAGGLMETLKVGGLFGLWYALNIGYNIYNKKALNAMGLPWIVGTVQMLLGIFIFAPFYLVGALKKPGVPSKDLKKFIPVGVMHMLGHVFGVISFGAGAISFTHIVKASEPLFTALGSAVFFKQFFAMPVYLSLLPVVAGVGLASLKELTFSWLSFGTAMGSNLCCALRGVFSKNAMTGSKYENLDALNLYNLLTILSGLMLIPATALMEGGKARGVWDTAVAAGVNPNTFMLHAVLSGVYYYLYNAVAFLTLEQVHPVTHAVGNTIKRVVIILTSVIVFKTQMTPLGTLGSAMAIGGVFIYSLVKQRFDKKK